MAKKKRGFFQRLKNKYKLVILNDDTFEEKASFTLTRLNVFVLGSVLAVILIGITSSMFVFTPLKEYIPGYADVSVRSDLTLMIQKADSLEIAQRTKDVYFENLRNIINGTVGDAKADNKNNKPILMDSINLATNRPNEEAKLREMIESVGEYDLNEDAQKSTRQGIAAYTFFSPIKGMQTEDFNQSSNHYGIDIVARKDEAIKATLSGTVIFSAFTSENGYVIALQHGNNLVSFYKHASVLLKKVGSFVRAGEAIAIVGDTGELSNGPHLHFELWYNGSPVNPAEYMAF